MALYVIRDATQGPEGVILGNIVKIGYSADERYVDRESTYKTENPMCVVLRVIEGGTQLHESGLHRKFRKYRFIGREWFLYNQEMVDYLMNTSLEEIEKDIISEFVVPKNKEYLISEVDKVYYFFKDTLPITKSELLFRLVSLERDDVLSYLEEVYSVDINEYERVISLYEKELGNIDGIYDRLKRLCEISFEGRNNIVKDILRIFPEDNSIAVCFALAGPEKCRSYGYNITKIKNYLNIITIDLTAVDNEVLSNFKEGIRYPKSEIKTTLQDIYDRNSYESNAKATDLERWFIIKSVNFMSNGKKTHGFEIIKRK